MFTQQFLRTMDVRLLARPQPQFDRLPLGIARYVELGAEAAARAAERFILFFSGAPAAC